MATKVDVQARNIRLTDRIKKHVEERAGKLDHYLPVIEEAFIELTHHKSARNANDRNVAQITVRGKGLLLRTEERADEILAAFDVALEKLQRHMDAATVVPPRRRSKRKPRQMRQANCRH